MKVSKAIWLIPLLGTLAMPAFADRDYDDDYRYSRIEHRLDRQHYRIKDGVRSGELTRKEARRLRKQQRHIAKMERRFSRDGHLDRQERRTLRRELDDASDRIYRYKHNDRYRNEKQHKTTRYDDHGYRYKSKQRDIYRIYDDSKWAITFSLWDHF